MTSTVTRLLWTDIETTGLDPEVDHILEIGMILTDTDLNELTRFHAVVRFDGQVDGFIARMHGSNGLLAECGESDDPVARVAQDANTWIAGLGRLDDICLAGSSVQFDERFLAANGIDLTGLDYHQFNVSAYGQALDWWTDVRLPRHKTHRVSDCLDDSLRLAQHMRKTMQDAVGESFLEGQG